MRVSRVVGSVLWLGLSIATAATAATAARVEGVLSEAQVLCDGARLAGFLRRAALQATGSNRATQLVVTLSGTGDFAGIATQSEAGGPESTLAFSSNGEETTLLRNPSRPQLFSVSLTRNDLNSDLESTASLRLSVNPTLDLINPAEAGLLALDSQLGGRSKDAKPGRGLGALLTPCHDPLGARDVHVLRVLSKMVRGRSAGASEVRTFEIALYRGTLSDSYRLDVFPLAADGTPRGRIAGLLQTTYDGGGALLGGTLRLLPSCGGGEALDCTEGAGGLSLVRPTAAGVPSPEILTVQTGGTSEVVLDWSLLLDGTSWRRPL